MPVAPPVVSFQGGFCTYTPLSQSVGEQVQGAGIPKGLGVLVLESTKKVPYLSHSLCLGTYVVEHGEARLGVRTSDLGCCQSFAVRPLLVSLLLLNLQESFVVLVRAV